MDSMSTVSASSGLPPVSTVSESAVTESTVTKSSGLTHVITSGLTHVITLGFVGGVYTVGAAVLGGPVSTGVAALMGGTHYVLTEIMKKALKNDNEVINDPEKIKKTTLEKIKEAGKVALCFFGSAFAASQVATLMGAPITFKATVMIGYVGFGTILGGLGVVCAGVYLISPIANLALKACGRCCLSLYLRRRNLEC